MRPCRRAWTRNCGTLTEAVVRKREAELKVGPTGSGPTGSGSTEREARGAALPVGPFFIIVALIGSIAAFVLLRTQPVAALGVIAFTLIGAGLAGTAVYRMLAPLTGDIDASAPLIEGRTRAALERDKALTLRALKELEFDRAMGKLSEGDFSEMRDRLRARAVRLMRQLDEAATFREQIERDLAAVVAAGELDAGSLAAPSCAACGAIADPDARFCKMCGKAIPSTVA